MKLCEILGRASMHEPAKPRRHIPWITGPLNHTADNTRNENSTETKWDADESVIELRPAHDHPADFSATIFKHHHEATSIELFYDLFFVANLATFTANHEIDTPGTLLSYVLFISLMWSTWLQTSLIDVRFSSDSFFDRACKLISFGIFTGFAIVGPIFDTGKSFQDAKAFKAMSLILMASRLALMIQYGVVLWYVRGYKKVSMPLLLHVGIMFVSAMVFLGLTFSFRYGVEDGEVRHYDPEKVTLPSRAYVGWYVVIIVEAIAVVAISSLWRVVSVKHTHLVGRVGLLTLIVMGEGIIGMTKAVTYVARYSAFTSSATIGVVVAAVSLIYLIWVLYFDQIEHDRFGTIRQQIWVVLHYPLHIAILLALEGSTQFITWWIAVENYQLLYRNFNNSIARSGNDTILLATDLNKTLESFDAGFKKASIPNFNSNLTLIRSLNLTNPHDSDQIDEIIGNMVDLLVAWLFEVFGFTPSEDLTTKVEDDLSKAQAIYDAFQTVFLFFLIAAGCVLMILGVMYGFGKKHKSRGEIASVTVRILAGLGLALVSCSGYTQAGVNLINSPMTIPLVVIVYLIVVVVDHVLIWHANKPKANLAVLSQSTEAWCSHCEWQFENKCTFGSTLV